MQHGDRLSLGIIASAVSLLLLFNGCGIFSEVIDFMHVRYQNVVGYFNTYYNAKRAFDEAVEEIEQSEEKQPLSLKALYQSLITPAVPASKQKFDVVIEKCSRLLQYYPDSKWVDDALFLIGKSYYYQTEYLKAGRKFAELITEFPNSSLYLEAKLWLGKSLLKSKNRDEALATLNDVIKQATESGDDDLVAEAHSVIGEFYIAQGDYQKAIPEFEGAVQMLSNGQRKGKAQYFVGELYRQIGKPDTAARKYIKVIEYTSEPRLRFHGLFQYAVLQRELNRYDVSLAVLRDLLSDERNYDFFPQIRLEIANSLNARGDLEEAIAQYQYVDTTYRRTDVSAKGYYALGYLWEKKKGDYRQAADNYEKARNEFPNSEITASANERAEYMRNYLNLVKTLKDKDSVLNKLLHPDSVWVVDSVKLASMRAADSIKQAIARADSLKKSGKSKDTTAAAHADSGDKSDQKPASRDTSLGTSADSLKLSGPPRKKIPGTVDSTAVSAVRSGIGDAMYGLAELFFLHLEEPDSAIFWYSKVIDEFPKAEYIPTALYSLASLYHTYKPESQQTVDSLYQRIIEKYPKTAYAAEARKALGVSILEESPDPGESLYVKGDSLLSKNKNREAITVFQEIVLRYPKSEYAARAQYAIGWIYENVEGKFDSATSNYRRLLKDYPNSQYAALVKDKIAEVDASLKDQQGKKSETTGGEQKKVESQTTEQAGKAGSSGKQVGQLDQKGKEKTVDELEEELMKKKRTPVKQDTSKAKRRVEDID